MCCTYKIATFILFSEIIIKKIVIPYLPLSAIFAFLRTTNAFDESSPSSFVFSTIDRNPLLMHS